MPISAFCRQEISCPLNCLCHDNSSWKRVFEQKKRENSHGLVSKLIMPAPKSIQERKFKPELHIAESVLVSAWTMLRSSCEAIPNQIKITEKVNSFAAAAGGKSVQPPWNLREWREDPTTCTLSPFHFVFPSAASTDALHAWELTRWDPSKARCQQHCPCCAVMLDSATEKHFGRPEHANQKEMQQPEGSP